MGEPFVNYAFPHVQNKKLAYCDMCIGLACESYWTSLIICMIMLKSKHNLYFDIVCNFSTGLQY